MENMNKEMNNEFEAVRAEVAAKFGMKIEQVTDQMVRGLMEAKEEAAKEATVKAVKKTKEEALDSYIETQLKTAEGHRASFENSLAVLVEKGCPIEKILALMTDIKPNRFELKSWRTLKDKGTETAKKLFLEKMQVAQEKVAKEFNRMVNEYSQAIEKAKKEQEVKKNNQGKK